ncbi:hypothetical protein [Streptococcus equi]|uniref:hypothetical protein n=1 Tax=Streptococcus equi TaxID=1336 RepID=UPI001E51CC88|nr:hypothetical protein [Streptococcus equi]
MTSLSSIRMESLTSIVLEKNLIYYDVKASNNNGFVTISQEAGRQTPFKAQLTIPIIMVLSP